MDRQNFAIYWDRLRKNFEFEISRGYTLIELMVVIAIIAVIAVVSLFGLNNFRDVEAVKSASKQMLADLRSLQNRTINGGVPIQGGTIPSINIFTVISPSAVSYQINNPPALPLPSPVSMSVED